MVTSAGAVVASVGAVLAPPLTVSTNVLTAPATWTPAVTAPTAALSESVNLLRDPATSTFGLVVAGACLHGTCAGATRFDGAGFDGAGFDGAGFDAAGAGYDAVDFDTVDFDELDFDELDFDEVGLLVRVSLSFFKDKELAKVRNKKAMNIKVIVCIFI